MANTSVNQQTRGRVEVGEIKVGLSIAKWLLRRAEVNDVVEAFDSARPHYCHLCDQPTPRNMMAKHVAAHRTQLERLEEQRRREQKEQKKRNLALARDARRLRMLDDQA